MGVLMNKWKDTLGFFTARQAGNTQSTAFIIVSLLIWLDNWEYDLP